MTKRARRLADERKEPPWPYEKIVFYYKVKSSFSVKVLFHHKRDENEPALRAFLSSTLQCRSHAKRFTPHKWFSGAKRGENADATGAASTKDAASWKSESFRIGSDPVVVSLSTSCLRGPRWCN